MAVIKIRNNANIDIGDEREYTQTLSNYTNLPKEGFIFLFFLDHLLPNKQAVCVPKSLLYLSGWPYSHIVDGNDFLDPWDCYIAISRKWCERKEKYPAYFTYLIGHELGHAKFCLSDLDLHKFYCLIELYFRKNFRHDKIDCHKLPHEKRFDKFGIYISQKFYQRSELNAEIESLIHEPDCEDRDRLKWMKETDGSCNLKGLRKELIDFSVLYKPDMISFWEKEKKKKGDKSLTSKIDNFENLFELSQPCNPSN